MAGFLGEFIIVGILYFYYRRYEPSKLKTSDQVSVFAMAVPALCDFFENVLLIFGTTQIFPSLVAMSRALVLPITAILSKFLIKKLFTCKMITALLVLTSGLTLATFVQYQGEMTED